MGNSTDITPTSYETTPNAVALPIFCALALFSAAVPFKEHWARKNIPMCSLIVVLCVVNFIQFVSTIIWRNDNFSSWWHGYGWCDVGAILKIPLITAVSSTTCCITMNLARAFDIDNPVSQTRAAKRRRTILDMLFCFGIPALQIILHYTIQINRYDIATIYGCVDATDNSWPTILISWIWPPIYGILNVSYALLVVYRLRKHRTTFVRTLSSNGSNLTSRGFFKIFLFSCSLLVVFFPIVMYFFYLNLSQLTGNSIHYSWSRVHDPDSWPTITFISLTDEPSWQYDAWCPIVQATLTFFYFGMGAEAKEQYRQIMVKCRLANIWPSLLQPRGGNGSFNNQRNSTSSWHSRMDVVGHAVRYFDNQSRKASQGTTMECSIHAKSRKTSSATFDHISLATSPRSPTDQRKNTLTPDTILTNPDPITTAPPYPEPTAVPQTSTTFHHFEVMPDPSASQHHARSFLGSFRTHINLPFPLFHPKRSINTDDRTQAQCTCDPSPILQPPPSQQQQHRRPDTTTIDLEARSQPNVTPHTTTTFSAPVTGTSAVRTQIWSETGGGDSALLDDEWEPKLGTRAYRERERREMEAMKRELRGEVVVDTRLEQSTS